MPALIITDDMGGDFTIDVITDEAFDQIIVIRDSGDEHDVDAYREKIWELLYDTTDPNVDPIPRPQYLLDTYFCQVWVIENLKQKYEINNILFLQSS